MRWRADLGRLPGWARYGIALVVTAVVVAIVLMVRPVTDILRAPTWYLVAVRIVAVALLMYLAGRLVWRAVRLKRRR